MARGIGDRQALLRSAGGVLLAVGCLVLLSRRSATHQWSKFELMLLIAAPAALLYLLALHSAPRVASGRTETWRSVLLVTAVLLAPVALFLFLDWAGASTKHLLYDAGVLVATAIVAIAGARRARAPFAFLPAGLALLGAWILVGFKIIHDPSADTVRWVLLAGGALLLIAAAAVSVLAESARGAAELGVAGAVGAVSAGVLGIFVGGFGAVSAIATGANDLIAPHLSGGQTLGWDIYLLVVSLALVLAGARSRARGLGYVGAIGLLFFIESVGTEISRRLAGHSPSGSLAGWPLVLVVLGVGGLAASWTRPGRRPDSA
jgi:hypothetical protein